jgi:hypothetical protein
VSRAGCVSHAGGRRSLLRARRIRKASKRGSCTCRV